MAVLVGPTGCLFFGEKKNADEPGCCLSLHCDMIHALVTRGFPSFRWFWQESVYCKRFFTKRGGRPSLSRFVFPSQLASLRGKSNSVGSEVGHYEQTSRLPNVWWRDKKGPDDLLFAPHVVVTSSLNPLKSSKGNELNAAWIQTLKKPKEQMYYGESFQPRWLRCWFGGSACSGTSSLHLNSPEWHQNFPGLKQEPLTSGAELLCPRTAYDHHF